MEERQLVSKSGMKSIVLYYCGLKLGADGKPVDDGSAICQSCRKRVLAKHGNTSNLYRIYTSGYGTIQYGTERSDSVWYQYLKPFIHVAMMGNQQDSPTRRWSWTSLLSLAKLCCFCVVVGRLAILKAL